MNHFVFTIYDGKAQAHLPPFILPKKEMAQRIFSDAINSKDHQFGKNPEDYTLFCLGIFDDSTGRFLPEKTPLSLGLGVEYVRTADVTAMEGHPNAETIRSNPTPVGNGSPIQPSPPSDNSPE